MNKTDLQQESMENLASCSWFAKEKPSKNLLIIQHLRTVHNYMTEPIHLLNFLPTVSDTIYCFCFAVEKFHSLASFLSFPEKLSRLPVTLPTYLRHS